MKVHCISDQHGLLPEIPRCDVLVIAGDVCPVNGSHAVVDQARWLDKAFRPWLEAVPADKIIGIAGNHDFVFEAGEQPDDLPWVYLQDTGYIHDGAHFHGYPWVPNLPRWAFHATLTDAQARLERIPYDVDILISHGPPRGKGDDVAADSYSGRKRGQLTDQNVGEPLLNQAIRDRSEHLKAVVFGHIHECAGQVHHHFGVPLYNVAIVDGAYRPVRDPGRTLYL